MDEHLVGRRQRRAFLADERGFTLIELLVVVVIVGVLAAIAIPTYIGQQNKAKDTAAQAQLRTAATAQQLFYADEANNNEYASDVNALDAYGFRQGAQRVTVQPGSGGDSYCMYAQGGSGVFSITAESGRPSPGGC